MSLATSAGNSWLSAQSRMNTLFSTSSVRFCEDGPYGHTAGSASGFPPPLIAEMGSELCFAHSLCSRPCPFLFSVVVNLKECRQLALQANRETAFGSSIQELYYSHCSPPISGSVIETGDLRSNTPNEYSVSRLPRPVPLWAMRQRSLSRSRLNR
jgi:hypothetical protein